MRTEADENYLKEIYTLELDYGHATTSMLAERFKYSPATVTGMLKKLAQLHWVVYEPYRGVTLTETGRAIALEVIRHHRLLETYLAQALNIPWDRVHEEADKLEHALSEYLEARIDELLGHPTQDPHGSPIPSLNGQIANPARLRLADLAVGDTAEIIEVDDHYPELLSHLDQLNLHLNTQITITAIEPIDGLITLQAAGQSHILGQTSASEIIVKKLPEA
jgi:DtxR family transcriptional regulator, Mn-dependent transcriptional regulator